MKHVSTLVLAPVVKFNNKFNNKFNKIFALGLALSFFAFHAQAKDLGQRQFAGHFDSTWAASSYPSGPHESMTPGDLCSSANSYRYPERIPYCKRNVESDLKREIIRLYDQRFGYRIGSMERSDFKIDHYIPLCAGGSNQIENLWPQHKSVYTITDPLEQLLCEKMAQGKLKQVKAVEIIKKAKNDLSTVDAIIDRLNSL